MAPLPEIATYYRHHLTTFTFMGLADWYYGIILDCDICWQKNQKKPYRESSDKNDTYHMWHMGAMQGASMGKGTMETETKSMSQTIISIMEPEIVWEKLLSSFRIFVWCFLDDWLHFECMCVLCVACDLAKRSAMFILKKLIPELLLLFRVG